jgi:hypothetical protein
MADALEKRITALEGDQQEEQQKGQVLTIKAVVVRTFFDADGTRHEETLPSTYDDEAEPSPASRPGATTVRVLWPREFPELRGPYAPRTMDAQDVTGD